MLTSGKKQNKVLALLGELKVQALNPNLVLAVGGCMAQQQEMGDYLRSRAPYVDLAFGTHNIHRLPQLLQEVKESDSILIEVWDKEQEIVEDLPAKRMDSVKAT